MERIAFLLGVKKGYEEEYKKRHDNLWPELSDEMSKAENFEGDDYDPEGDAFPDGLPEVFYWEG